MLFSTDSVSWMQTEALSTLMGISMRNEKMKTNWQRTFMPGVCIKRTITQHTILCMSSLPYSVTLKNTSLEKGYQEASTFDKM